MPAQGNPLKDAVKQVMYALHLDITRNQKYDRSAYNIMERKLRPASNCIDIGSHRGEFLKNILKFSPKGAHYAFEPIPAMFEMLQSRYSGVCKVLPYAISDLNGKTTFNYVVNAPAYSGIKQRKYDVKDPMIEEITVEMRTLDSVLPQDFHVDFIKLDVEGGEFKALKGAEATILRSKPLIIFEFGLGSAEFYDSEPGDVFDFLNSRCGLKIKVLNEQVEQSPVMSRDNFVKNFYDRKDYYFVASPSF